jgi:hypothetical protein
VIELRDDASFAVGHSFKDRMGYAHQQAQREAVAAYAEEHGMGPSQARMAFDAAGIDG